MATDVAGALAVRAHAAVRAAAQWRDPSSDIRERARRLLAGGIWPAPVVETALDNALWDVDEARVIGLLERVPELKLGNDTRAKVRILHVLVILPGNVIGPAIHSAFCAGLAGACATLKASRAERHLAGLVAAQFDAFGPPLAGCVRADYWSGSDLAAEAGALNEADRVIAFGSDATIAQIRSRSAACDVDVIGYGESYSVGYVASECDMGQAAHQAARDICLFDQRGCMSPQTIYVAGDQGRAVLFARTLAAALEAESRHLPRAALEPDEAPLVMDAVRRLAASAAEPTPHGLDTFIVGPSRDGVSDHVVAVESFGQPTCIGFGRIAVVKPCPSARDLTTQLKYYGRTIESIGLSAGVSEDERIAFRRAGPLRLCALGDMQRPPLGYRPSIEDLCAP